MITPELWTDVMVNTCADIFDKMMLPLTLVPAMQERPLPIRHATPVAREEVIASIGLTGEYNGSISLYLSEKLSLSLAGWLLESTYTELNTDVFESVGEMINMIAGGMKNRLSSDSSDIFDLSTPIVISGQDKNVFQGKNMDYINVPVETNQGIFFISLALDRS